MKKVKFNWAVFNTETGFRLTDYSIRIKAIYARDMILHDQPELRGKIECKQRGYKKPVTKA